MKRKPPEPPKPERKPKSLAQQFLAHLQNELRIAREDLEYYRGRCANYELAIAQFGNDRQREFVARMDTQPRTPITATPVMPPPTDWAQAKAKWNSMTDEQKEAALAQGPPA